jgi:hypothetical protein
MMDKVQKPSAPRKSTVYMDVTPCSLVRSLPTFRTNVFLPCLRSLSKPGDRLCGLVVRVPGYRCRGPGSIPGAIRFSEK